ncbi:hypothetical protein CCH79_00011025 [Gambusia affinis]|uniref:Uncharacterized protein n=1 Tax=Gambusia affinis TaxID=33528 RepID=A0A315URH3_GAMAF|nr:hypothetical protein CCH79_00011025 [Gambusia affinis]
MFIEKQSITVKWKNRRNAYFGAAVAQEVTSLVGAQRVEGGHHKPPVEGSASQQPLGFFGVAGVGVLHKHLVGTKGVKGRHAAHRADTHFTADYIKKQSQAESRSQRLPFNKVSEVIDWDGRAHHAITGKDAVDDGNAVVLQPRNRGRLSWFCGEFGGTFQSCERTVSFSLIPENISSRMTPRLHRSMAAVQPESPSIPAWARLFWSSASGARYPSVWIPTHLVSLFEAQPEVDELEALVVGAPQDVARFEVSVDVAFPVKEGKSLQDTPTVTVRSAATWRCLPYTLDTIAAPHQQLRHADIQELQQEAARSHAHTVVIVALELLHCGRGGSAGADLVNRGRHSLTEPGLNGPDLAENLKQHRPHALVHADLGRDTFWSLNLGGWLGRDAVSHRRAKEERKAEEGRQLVERWKQLREHCEPSSMVTLSALLIKHLDESTPANTQGGYINKPV